PGADGALILTPLELLDRLAALVPPPRIHRHRYFGVLAPSSPLRPAVTALASTAITPPPAPTPQPTAEPAYRRAARYAWALLLARIYAVFCLVLIVASIPVPFEFRIDILRVWQFSAILPLIYFIIFQIGNAFGRELKSIRVTHDGVLEPGLMRAVGHVLRKTVPGNLLIGAFVAAFCAVFDILSSLFFNFDFVLTNYGFFFFVIGVTRVLSNRFRGLYTRIEGLSYDLDRKSRDLSETRVQFGISREKYRLLVEGSRDMIFSLDENLRFMTANRALHDNLGINREEIGRKTLRDLLYKEADQRSVAFQFVQEKLDRFLKDKEPMHIKLDFKNSFAIEPVSMQVRLEYIQIAGRNEIFGRATRVTDDLLNRYLLEERHSYRIGNLLLVADDLSYRITRNLMRYTDKSEHSLLRIAVREIIINAIEHGNLAITFDEKTKEMTSESYFQYIAERQKDPRFKDRTVTIDYELDADRVVYVVSDQGSGFNYSQFLTGGTEANDLLLAHGRGIALAKGIFDDIIYENGGSRVSLIKRFNGRTDTHKV
ncbi:MAG: PAS domain-containing protein, partial [Chrysiogenales bacterium]